jgi:alkylated DNA nucleotide flippase Atl1
MLSMGIWDIICEHIRHNQDASVSDFMGQKKGSMCSKCGHYSATPTGILDHMKQKHPHEDGQGWMCKLQPAIRDGEGKGDYPTLQQQVDEIIKKAKEARNGGKWTKQEIEETERRWHRNIMAQWQQGVQKKQISRTEASNVRKEGSFPIFIKEQILPIWDAWKGA